MEEKLYREAIVNDQKVSLSYIKILALGPGQVGKSTFLYRLLGLMEGNILTADPKTQPQSSTGLTELHEACITYTSMTGAIMQERWRVFDKSSDLQCQLDGLMSLVTEQRPRKIPIHTAEGLSSSNKQLPQQLQDEHENNIEDVQKPFPDTTKKARLTATEDTLPSCHPSLNMSSQSPQMCNINRTIKEFKQLQAECNLKLTSNKEKFHILFNIADIGGQPAFLEMIPALTIGPAFYLVFMKLLQGLTTQYPAAFKCKDGRGSNLCENYTYTSEEVIFTALSSIACFGHADEEIEKYIADSGDKTSSLALLVGTFKDKIKDENFLEKLDSQVKLQLDATDFYKKGLVFRTNFLRVNNYSAPETEIEDQRRLFEVIFKQRFHKYVIPTRWLALSICLKLLARVENKYEVSFDDCVKLGNQLLGMKEEMVKVALQFLHKYIGLVMYFPNNSSLRNVVICDPQVVFSSISEFVFNVYDPKKMYITEAQHDHFVRTGFFSPQDIKLLNEDLFSKKLLSIDTLVNLLVHLNIIVEVPSNLHRQADGYVPPSADPVGVTTKQKTCYFLPAVLQTAESSLLVREANGDQYPEPLCIRFPTGYLPLGFVCALSANLIAESNLNLIPFEKEGQQVTYKNKFKFRFQGEIDIVMVSGAKYCEFRVSRWSGTTEFWDDECCPRIRTIICEAADRVIQSLRHSSLYYKSIKDATYELAFTCPKHPRAEIGHEPLASFVYDTSARNAINYNCPLKIKCVDQSCGTCTELTPQMQLWFGEVRYNTHLCHSFLSFDWFNHRQSVHLRLQWNQ